MGGRGGSGGGGEVTVTVDDAQRCRLVVAASIIEWLLKHWPSFHVRGAFPILRSTIRWFIYPIWNIIKWRFLAEKIQRSKLAFFVTSSVGRTTVFCSGGLPGSEFFSLSPCGPISFRRNSLGYLYSTKLHITTLKSLNIFLINQTFLSAGPTNRDEQFPNTRERLNPSSTGFFLPLKPYHSRTAWPI